MKKSWQKSPDTPPRKTGRWLQQERERLFANEPLCRMCAAAGVVRVAVERDHIKPIAEGGTEDDSNIQPLCREHNQERLLKQRGHKRRPRIGLDGWPIEE
jgi:5-methylcytosine-specific restriction protein A